MMALGSMAETRKQQQQQHNLNTRAQLNQCLFVYSSQLCCISYKLRFSKACEKFSNSNLLFTYIKAINFTSACRADNSVQVSAAYHTILILKLKNAGNLLRLGHGVSIN